ncbi:hypothetical protein [Nocardia wallacei]|uniref:hypothetical protein n=1 Tax=Nocardia wallacei TaxID=480035 RepID=UPI0024560E45|nr:hypothetical protein [Nocardia wallacei]
MTNQQAAELAITQARLQATTNEAVQARIVWQQVGNFFERTHADGCIVNMADYTCGRLDHNHPQHQIERDRFFIQAAAAYFGTPLDEESADE